MAALLFRISEDERGLAVSLVFAFRTQIAEGYLVTQKLPNAQAMPSAGVLEHLKRLGMHLNRLGMHLNRLGMHLNRPEVQFFEPSKHFFEPSKHWKAFVMHFFCHAMHFFRQGELPNAIGLDFL